MLMEHSRFDLDLFFPRTMSILLDPQDSFLCFSTDCCCTHRLFSPFGLREFTIKPTTRTVGRKKTCETAGAREHGAKGFTKDRPSSQNSPVSWRLSDAEVENEELFWAMRGGGWPKKFRLPLVFRCELLVIFKPWALLSWVPFGEYCLFLLGFFLANPSVSLIIIVYFGPHWSGPFGENVSF